MTMLYGTSYGTSPLTLRALPLRKGDTSTNHKSNIINHPSNINRHEKRTFGKNPQHHHHHPDCNRNYLRGNIVHVAILKHNPKTQPATRNFATFAIFHFRVLSPVGL